MGSPRTEGYGIMILPADVEQALREDWAQSRTSLQLAVFRLISLKRASLRRYFKSSVIRANVML